MVAHNRAATAPMPADPALAGARILVVEARYYEALADELLAGALAVIGARIARLRDARLAELLGAASLLALLGVAWLFLSAGMA